MQTKFVILSDVQKGSITPAGVFRLEILRTGRWNLGAGDDGEDQILEVTPKLLGEIKSNFEARTYFPVPVDGPARGGTAHSPNEAHDCGFVNGLEVTPDGEHLFAVTGITNKDVAQMLNEGSLSTCSSELLMGWRDPEREQTLNVLCGLGLTNRPVIKNMATATPITINLSERLGDKMPENKTVEQLQAELVKLKEDAAKATNLSERLSKLEADNKVLLTEKQVFEATLRKKESEDALNSVELSIKTRMLKDGAFDVPAATALFNLAEAIVYGGVRHITLAEGSMPQANDAGGSIFHVDGGIRKCDLLALLTEAINAFPGDVVHTTALGRSGDERTDEDGQLDMGAEDGKKPPFNLMERFSSVRPRNHGGSTTEVILAEAQRLAKKDNIGVADATQIILKQKGIKSTTQFSGANK